MVILYYLMKIFGFYHDYADILLCVSYDCLMSGSTARGDDGDDDSDASNDVRKTPWAGNTPYPIILVIFICVIIIIIAYHVCLILVSYTEVILFEVLISLQGIKDSRFQFLIQHFLKMIIGCATLYY